MRKLITILSVLTFVGVVGCGGEQRRVTTTETISTTPVDPIVTEKRTTVHTETHQ